MYNVVRDWKQNFWGVTNSVKVQINSLHGFRFIKIHFDVYSTSLSPSSECRIFLLKSQFSVPSTVRPVILQGVITQTSYFLGKKSLSWLPGIYAIDM